MKAAVVENKKMVLKEVAEPTFAKNEVLVEIHAAALNRADLLQKQGTYPTPESSNPGQVGQPAGEG